MDGRIPLDAVVFHVILSPSLVILNEVKDLALRVNSAKDLSSLDSSATVLADKSAPPHPPEDGFVLLAKNDTLNEVVMHPQGHCLLKSACVTMFIHRGISSMYTVTKEIDFCYGHRLLNYDGACRHLHGHNARVEVELERNTLDERGMVFDFSEIKRILQKWIDETLDHTMLLSEQDPLIPVLKEKRERFYVLESNPTAETIAKLIFDYAKSKRLPVVRVTLWETERSFATYREPACHSEGKARRI